MWLPIYLYRYTYILFILFLSFPPPLFRVEGGEKLILIAYAVSPIRRRNLAIFFHPACENTDIPLLPNDLWIHLALFPPLSIFSAPFSLSHRRLRLTSRNFCRSYLALARKNLWDVDRSLTRSECKVHSGVNVISVSAGLKIPADPISPRESEKERWNETI